MALGFVPYLAWNQVPRQEPNWRTSP